MKCMVCTTGILMKYTGILMKSTGILMRAGKNYRDSGSGSPIAESYVIYGAQLEILYKLMGSAPGPPQRAGKNYKDSLSSSPGASKKNNKDSGFACLLVA